MSFDLYKTLKKAESLAEWVGLRQVTENSTYGFLRNGHKDEATFDFDQGVIAEVLVNGQFYYAATNNVTEEGVLAAVKQAVKSASSKDFHIHPFTKEFRPKVLGDYKGPGVKTDLSQMCLADMNALCESITKNFSEKDKIISASLSYHISEKDILFVSSNGSEIHQQFALVSPYISTTAKDGSEVQTRTLANGRNCTQSSWDKVFTKNHLEEQMDLAYKQVLELLAAEQCPTEEMCLILAPDQMMMQIHESIGHPLELDRILGDERNYAGFSFVEPKDFGHLQYGSKLMNVTFDPTFVGEAASYNFDDLGIEAQKEYLIKDGQLLRGLGSIDSQKRSGLPGVSSARATSWFRAPIDRMGNINLEPGTSSLDEMVSSVERGIYMETNASWSIDDYRNKFQFGCQYGRLIENGKFTKVVKNPNYRGITNDFWGKLTHVGRASEFFGTPYCGKGEPNQVIWVGHASPHCHFKNIEVFGGGQ